MATKTIGAEYPQGWWRLQGNGWIGESVDFPHDTTYKFKIFARGTKAQNGWPNMGLCIDGQTRAEMTVNSIDGQLYTVEVPVRKGIRTVAITFTNDLHMPPEDRNLFVNWMRVQ